MQEQELLPADLIGPFSIAYNESFPELKFNEQEAVAFISRKFPLTKSTNSRLIAVLKSDSGEISSGYGVLRRTYSSASRALKVGLVCDVFTGIKYRKQGLFKKVSLLAISREDSDGTDFLIGYPVRHEVMPGHLSVGWKHVFNMNVWWAIPKVGTMKNISELVSTRNLQFAKSSTQVKLVADKEFLEHRFTFFGKKYFISTLDDGRNFAIFRKSKLKHMPFICIVYLQSDDSTCTKKLISDVRKFAFVNRAIGVLGCWNLSFANSLFIREAGLRMSSMYQKVIIRELNGYVMPASESDFELSWFDSDTL